MKATISKEYETAIYDYIFVSLIVETLEGKARKGIDVEDTLKTATNDLVRVKKYLRDNQMKLLQKGESVIESDL